MKNKDAGIDFLRFVAIVLVINSHMDAFYPISSLGTGGAIGNALFFMLSSYGLYLSQQCSRQDFWIYFKKRVIRIYPAVWSAVCLLIAPISLYYYLNAPAKLAVLQQEFNFTDPLGFANIIFFPPPAFWFLQALMLYYVIGFLFISRYSALKNIIAYAFLVSAYIALYANISSFDVLVIEQEIKFKLLFYSMLFLFGINLAFIDKKIQYNGVLDFVVLSILLLLMYGHKIMAINGILAEFQFVQQLLIFPIAFFFMRVSRSDVVKKIMRLRGGNFINLLAAMTLELYIVHGPIRELLLPYVGGFPLNVLLYLLTTLVVSFLLFNANQRFTRLLV